ncbi:sulfite exporter TauE/SafE family protein [Kribbella qitaiheensis]|uniref:Probable membrane transporter protein n=1 Tax=Kribbella qitaiheensis TaxID=1544730 RepID=A0A7G6XAA4_9ACTN|nr:sulfite exporter TauE/SafE family protein [Kribbella qitaiheensis]
MAQLLIVLLAGLVSGALNSVGGGGSFVAFPVLVAAGLAPVTANAATTVALLPGGLASLWVYRRELQPLAGTSTRTLTATSVVGGGLGAVLLLSLPSDSFDAVVPWLLACATLILAFGRRVAAALKTGALNQPTILGGQFVLALYGGYFGGAVGLMMVAFWSIGLGLDPARGNPPRVAQLAAIYFTATVIFLLASDVADRPTTLAALIAGAVAGGFSGATVARRLSPSVLRALVLTLAIAMTVVYFVKASR